MKYIAFKMAFLHTVVGLLWITLSDKILLLIPIPIIHLSKILLNRMGGFSSVFLPGTTLFIAILLANRHLWKANKELQLLNVALGQRHLLPGNIDSLANIHDRQNKDIEIRRMGDIIKNISNMVLITDKQKRISWANPALEDFAGLELNELTANPIAYFLNSIYADTELAEQLNNRMEKQEVFSMDISVFTGKDKPYWVHGDFTPLFDDLDQYTGYIIIFTDISGIKKKEESLLRQNEVLREIAWIESHEVRRPLASILGLIELLQACTSDDEKQEVFEMILLSGEELDVMIRKINERIIEVMV